MQSHAKSTIKILKSFVVMKPLFVIFLPINGLLDLSIMYLYQLNVISLHVLVPICTV